MTDTTVQTPGSRQPGAHRPGAWFPWFKWSVYSLLAINILLFLLHETITEGMDSLAWVVLLLLFEWETSQMEQPYVSRWERWGIHGGRIAAYALVLWSAFGYSSAAYIAEYGVVDMWNAWTWILIVLVLEYDVYVPGRYSRWEWYLRNGLKLLLYAALFVYAVLWGLDGSWLDFYDALLWILCFFAIELNVFAYEDSIPYADEEEATPAPASAD
jgi:hypothetical protein